MKVVVAASQPNKTAIMNTLATIVQAVGRITAATIMVSNVREGRRI